MEIPSIYQIDAQPAPVTTPRSQRVLDAVLIDLQTRAEKGRAHYSCYLHTHNGRNALQDAYEEALDLAMYLKQALIEQESPAQ